MRFEIITLFPEMFTTLNHGVIGRAIEAGLAALSYWNPRDFTRDKHKRVDDRSYGGGPGMVMQAQPLCDAIRAAKAAQPEPNTPVMLLSPQGRLLTQASVKKLAQAPALILVNGRYEGIDERLLQTEIDEQWSIGDYVLSGGELASMVVIDAIVRLLPGALGHPDSAQQDSFSDHLLDYPHYTRPCVFNDLAVPEVLVKGDHSAIQRWRLKQSLGKTWQLRPDMLKEQPLTAEEQMLLNEFIDEQ